MQGVGGGGGDSWGNLNRNKLNYNRKYYRKLAIKLSDSNIIILYDVHCMHMSGTELYRSHGI